MQQNIKQFFESESYAVVGASKNREKFGNKVLRCYLAHNKVVVPVNPIEATIEGVSCVAKISDLPDNVKSISVVTPPKLTEQIVEDAIKKGIKNIWMQPGAESEIALARCQRARINVIAGGPCVLVELGCHQVDESILHINNFDQ